MRARHDTNALLALWEAALGQPAQVRTEALLQAWPQSDGPASTLGERNASLIDLHSHLFGREIELLSHCPSCNAVAQFSADCNVLSAQLRPVRQEAPPYRLQTQGHEIEYRLPSSADLSHASTAKGDEDFTQCLLERCVLSCMHEGQSVATSQLPEPVLEALSQQMQALDPGASVSFTLDCPQCAARWHAPLDVGEMLWHKVRTAAERVLLDIDALARAYGWTEREVLRLSPTRRAAYLQMVAAGG